MASSVHSSLPLPGHYAGAVLDLDGSLVQTEKLWSHAKDILFARHGVEYSDSDHLAVFGTSDVFTAEYFTRRFDLPPSEMQAVRDEYMGISTAMFEEGVEISEGAVELVDRLSGAIPLALASNTRRSQVTTILASTPFGDRFDAVITGDDGTPKPAPDLYQLACERLGVDPRYSVALEDSPTGVAAAMAAGLTCIGVPSHPDERLDQADLVVDSLTELL